MSDEIRHLYKLLLIFNVFYSEHVYNEINSSSAYLVELFKIKLALPDGALASYLTPPPGMTLGRAAEFEKLAGVLNRAYRSPGKYFKLYLQCSLTYIGK